MTDDVSLSGKTIAHYEVLDKLGGGGVIQGHQALDDGFGSLHAAYAKTGMEVLVEFDGVAADAISAGNGRGIDSVPEDEG